MFNFIMSPVSRDSHTSLESIRGTIEGLGGKGITDMTYVAEKVKEIRELLLFQARTAFVL